MLLTTCLYKDGSIVLVYMYIDMQGQLPMYKDRLLSVLHTVHVDYVDYSMAPQPQRSNKPHYVVPNPTVFAVNTSIPPHSRR